jgi:hypothetical protein
MSSTLRIDASRANGAKSRGPITVAGRLASLANSAKSTGPVTPEGQACSSQNAFPQNAEPVRPYPRNAEAPGSTSGRHGILAESIVLDSESAEGFSDVLTTLQEELEPITSIESRYIETMALAEWRRLRLLCLEKEQITIETRRQEAADLSSLSDEAEGDTEVSPIR